MSYNLKNSTYCNPEHLLEITNCRPIFASCVTPHRTPALVTELGPFTYYLLRKSLVSSLLVPGLILDQVEYGKC